MALALDRGDVHVFYQATDAIDETAALAILSSNERLRHSQFVFDRDRRDYAAAHAVLRWSLSRYAPVAPEGWQFRNGPNGKPLIAGDYGGPPLAFNLSHTHGLVACAIAVNADVGVDVESVTRAVDEGVSRRFFAATEQAEIERATTPRERAERFFELWTLKEAYIKAIGVGLSHPLSTIVFEIGVDRSVVFTPPADVDAARWRFVVCAPREDYTLAVAARAAQGTLSTVTFFAGDRQQMVFDVR
jgi:4'-phosphopantetheinyl transferase